MRRRATFALAAACLAAAPAAAQHLPLRVGQTAQGQLAESDPRMTERGRFKVYRFEANEGQRLVATLRSRDFDAYLVLARSVGGITDEIEADDDRGGDTDSRIRFSVPVTGTYLLVAQSLAPDGMGAYTLSLEAAPQPTTAQPQPIPIGTVMSGRLADTDAVLDEDDTYYDSWTLSARDGQRLLVEMESDSFDTYLSFGRVEGGEFTPLEQNDDAGRGGTNSAVRVSVRGTGEYVIRANSVGTSTGPYTLRITERPAPPATATPRPVTAGAEVSGTLDDSDPVMEDDSFYDYWSYAGRAGEQLTITMSSEEFDSFMAFGRLNGTTFDEISSNDDGPEGLDSQIQVTLPSDGTYVIRTNSLNGGATGSYTLKVESSRNR
jgi:hypothetical protein